MRVGEGRRVEQGELAHKEGTDRDREEREGNDKTYRMMASTLMAAFSSFCCASRLATSRCAIL